MSDIQPTLDLIDGALDDYLSADAMRWTPDEDERVESAAAHGVLTAERLRRAQDQLREHAASPRLVFTPTTRVWMNGQEISHMVSGVTIERDAGQYRIGLNGGTPVVRDDIRVEVEQGGATYVIDEQRQPREVPLSRLEWGTLRSPLSQNISEISPDAYWPSEPVTAQQWIDANPTVGERIEPAAMAAWAESQGLQLDEWQRSMLDAIYDGHPPRRIGHRRHFAASQAIAEVYQALDAVRESMQALKHLRVRYLHSLYRQRQLARRRRNH